MQTVFQNFFASRRAGWMAGLTVAALLAGGQMISAQATTPTDTQTPASTTAPAHKSATHTRGRISNTSHPKKVKHSHIHMRETKATKVEDKLQNKYGAQVSKDALLPDQQLYDKAMGEEKSGHFDVARLDLQTLLNTYPDSQYLLKAKLAVADCWYKEGGTAALAQAEQEYTDFITFFPNSPEAAEAQMRVGDIYFKQMDSPDRDFTNGVKAEAAYRTMLQQYPDAPPKILNEGQQKLREVQELMGDRELDLGAFYASRDNWPASIARYQTLVDTYPLFSHLDEALIGMGDGYAAEAKIVRAQTNMPEGPKSQLLQEYDGKAANAYRDVVLHHAASAHVEDAKERLEEMGLPVPKPTPEELAKSEALEGSRAQYTIGKRLEVLFLRKPDTVTAATEGAPPLADPAITTAPGVLRNIEYDYCDAFHPKDPKACAALAAERPKEVETAIDSDTASSVTVPVPSGPLSLHDVPAGNGTSSDAATVDEAAPSSGGSGTGVGVEIVPSTTAAPATPDAVPITKTVTPASTLPAASGAQDPNNGLTAVGPKDNTPLPPVQPAAAAPDQVNEVAGQKQPVVAPKTKDTYDKQQESSSKHKKKKGIDKLNPF
jgi:outer membrane protein assembly factor BamD